MPRLRVGVLRGGPSREYDVSLKTGGAVLEHLPEQFARHDILIDKSGTWHWGGAPTRPERVAGRVDVLFNALHGEYGEDGQVQHQLERLGVPYTGSGQFSSALAMKKSLAKETLRQAGLRVPGGILLEAGEDAASYGPRVFARLAPPWVVKPEDRGSSVGLGLARTYPELAAMLAAAFAHSARVLVEEYIRGREATVGVVEHFRGARHYVLPVVEIHRPEGEALWHYQHKYGDGTKKVCPATFATDVKQRLETQAIAAHRALGLRDYSRADFIVGPRGIYILEVNSLPGLTEHSLMPTALAAVGCKYPDFLSHLVHLALHRQTR